MPNEATPEHRHQYGRRIEADGTWTLYHVYSGIPATLGSQVMTGLAEQEATATMLRLNRTNAALRRQERLHARGLISSPQDARTSQDICAAP